MRKLKLAMGSKMNRKGNWAMSHPVISFIVGLFAVVVVAGITVLVLDAFNSSTTTTAANTVFGNGITMLGNFTNQLGTVGTIGGVLLLLILIAAAGLYGYSVYQRR